MSSYCPDAEKGRLNTETAFELKLKENDLSDIELKKIENDLAEQLKGFCDMHGREIDAQASAKVLHKLGQVYQKRAPDKLSLIRSAALYNAALIRNPPNKQAIQKDLKHFCSLILNLANAENTAADLIKHSKNVQQKVLEMRKRVARKLCEIEILSDAATGEMLQILEQNKILSIQKLQNQIFDDFKQIMANVASFCEEVMGKPPCRFSLIGMGSLARREMTPFSDFESIIVLENGANQKESYNGMLIYFRWFSVIFQIVLINLQETIVPDVAISSLKSFFDSITPRGVSSDGMMPHASKNPLGRQEPTELKPWITELIKPLDHMLNFLTAAENLKNGYHLSDILTKTCFVYKDHNLFAEFEKSVLKTIENEENKESIMKDIKDQIVKDLQSFATRFSLATILKPNQEFNVKKVVYRSTTLFVAAFGRFCNIRATSCFDIINELQAKKEITNYAKHKLLYAVALACEIRLRWYTKENKQCDKIDSIQCLIKLVGRKSILSYFQIAYALQCDISKRLKLKQGHFYSFPFLLNLSLAYCFDDEKMMSEILSPNQLDSTKQWLYDFDQCLNILENQTTQVSQHKAEIEQRSSLSSRQDLWKQFQDMGDFLTEMQCIDDALECFQKSTELIERNIPLEQNHCKSSTELSRNRQRNISFNYQRIGYLQTMLCQHEESERSLKMSLDILHSLSPGSDIGRQIAITLRLYGQSLVESNKLKEAKKMLDESLEMSSIYSDYDASCTLRDLGHCLMKMNKLKEAKSFFDRSLQIRKRIPFDVNSDPEVSVTLYELGKCLMKINELKEAKSCFVQSLQIAKQLSSDVDSDREIYLSFYEFGRCLMKMNKLEKARQMLYKSLRIKERISADVDCDRGVAIILHMLGRCLMKMNKLKDAKNCLKRSLHIAQQTSTNIDFDREVYLSLHELGRCFIKINDLEEAKQYLDKSLQIKQRISSDVDCDRDVSVTLHELGRCLMEMNKLEEAKDHLNKSLQIKLQISSDVNSDREISITLHELGRCLIRMNELQEAQHSLEKSLQIAVCLSSDVDSDHEIYLTLHELGRCLMKMNIFDNANCCLQKALQIKQQISFDVAYDRDIALTQHVLGRCLMEMNEIEEAKYYLDKSLQITKQLSIDVDSDREVCLMLHDIGLCLMKMNELDEAKLCFDRSLQIRKRISFNVNSDREAAVTLHELGCCLMKMNELDQAKYILERSLQIQQQWSTDADYELTVSVTLHELSCCLIRMNEF